jgi:ParB-like chromosome segregation protein Spo0J
MASSKKVVVRSAKSTTRYTCIKLSQIVSDKRNDYCHRQSDALKDDRLAPLADNLVSEGQGTPMTVYDSGKRDPSLGIIYILIGGFRRFFALLFGIKQNLDHNRINESMEVDVVEIVQGADQTDEEFRQDLLVRSIAENEQRVQFSTTEKLAIVKQCKASRIPNPRAASALAMSESQFGRFAAIVEHDWLHDYVVDNCIGATDAAALVQLAKNKDRVDDLRQHLDTWVAAHQAMIDAEAEELRQIKKKLSGSAAHVKKYASPKLMKYWQDCLEHGRPLDNNVDLVFGIRIDRVKGTIEIPATTLKIV